MVSQNHPIYWISPTIVRFFEEKLVPQMIPCDQKSNTYYAEVVSNSGSFITNPDTHCIYFSGMLIFIADFYIQQLAFNFVQKPTGVSKSWHTRSTFASLDGATISAFHGTFHC